MSKNNVQSPAIVWLRRDLRIADNPALHAAREAGGPVIPLFILEDDAPRAVGAAARWWLHHALAALAGALKDAGAPLVLRRGAASAILPDLVAKTGARAVYWNRRYDAAGIETDREIKAALTEDGVEVASFNGNLLREPWELKTGSGGHYKVYSPFWKALQKAGPARQETRPAMRKIPGPDAPPASDALADWGLAPTRPNWARGFEDVWTPGEDGARARLAAFLNGAVEAYREDRDRPDLEATSRLSPHLAFGEISPLTIWTETRARIEAGDIASASAEKFLAEIAWREFSYNLLYHYPDLPSAPLRREFEDYPWRDDRQGLQAWQKGLTGYPIVDAGMRQLWRTGWMHNRVRMIVASFLVKDQLIPWREGEAWFWDTLVDADPANNAASWQWVAGCGADAAPYFRIFNPVTQAQKFDPDGDYVRAYVPELKDLSAKHLHAPWDAPESALRDAGVALGKTYPKPILDHAEARQRALKGYEAISGA